MEPLRMEFPAGVLKERAMEKMVKKAKEEGVTVVANINDIDVFANPESKADVLMKFHDMVRELVHFMEDNNIDPERFLTDEPFK
ncbi:MAG: hypothetical protein U9P90_03170 [Patescibacteria group bacterium]|nr:hypothetical protein [Patescibacteria group bacterium]